MSASHKSKIPNKMFFIQSITDIIVSISLTLDSILLKINNLSELSENFFTTLHFLYQYSVVLTVIILLLITIERFIAIKFPFQHRTFITANVIRNILVYIFLSSSIPGIVFATYCYLSRDRSLLITFGIIMPSIGLAIIITVYTLILISFYTIKKSIDARIHRQEESTSTSNRQIIVKERKKNIRIVIILFTMCTIYSITYLPLIVYNIYLFTTERNMGFNGHIFRNAINLLYYISALLNPLITTFFKEDYKHTLLKCFKRNAPAPAPAPAHNQRSEERHQEQQPGHHIETTAL